MQPLKTLASSSTFWTSILLPTAKVVLEKVFPQIAIPWEVIAAGVAAMGVRNAGVKIGEGLAARGGDTPPAS
jgi:hypothetical protein